MSLNLKIIPSQKRGFTLIEVMISLLLVLLALLFISRILIYTIDGNKKSYRLSQISQRLESCKDQLLSHPFDSEEIAPGTTVIPHQPFNINSTITSLSSTLKKIRLSITYKTIVQSITFYKSKYIKEVKND